MVPLFIATGKNARDRSRYSGASRSDSLIPQADNVGSPKWLLHRFCFGVFGCLSWLQVLDQKDLVSLLVVNEFVH